MKNPNDTIWDRPATFRLVAQRVQYYVQCCIWAHIESNGKTIGD